MYVITAGRGQSANSELNNWRRKCVRSRSTTTTMRRCNASYYNNNNNIRMFAARGGHLSNKRSSGILIYYYIVYLPYNTARTYISCAPFRQKTYTRIHVIIRRNIRIYIRINSIPIFNVLRTRRKTI